MWAEIFEFRMRNLYAHVSRMMVLELALLYHPLFSVVFTPSYWALLEGTKDVKNNASDKYFLIFH